MRLGGFRELYMVIWWYVKDVCWFRVWGFELLRIKGSFRAFTI